MSPPESTSVQAPESAPKDAQGIFAAEDTSDRNSRHFTATEGFQLPPRSPLEGSFCDCQRGQDPQLSIADLQLQRDELRYEVNELRYEVDQVREAWQVAVEELA